MFYRIKLRAKLIIGNKKISIFAFMMMSLLVRAFFALSFFSAIAVTVLMIILRSTNPIREDFLFNIFVFASLGAISLISVYLFAFFKAEKDKYFNKTVASNSDKSWSFTSEVKTCLKLLLEIVLLTVFRLLWFILFLSPSIILAVYLIYRLNNQTLALNVFYSLSGAAAVAAVFGILFAFCTVQRYSLVYRTLINQGRGVFEAVKESVSKTNGSSSSIALFKLSFLPWYALCLFVFPLFYVIPYYNVSYELLCKKNMSKVPGEPFKEKASVPEITKRIPRLE